MFPNETICIKEFEYSGQEIQDVGTLNGIGIFLIISIIAAVGLAIRGFFIYYIKYEAPGDRPINTLILSDQVGLFMNIKNRLMSYYTRSCTYEGTHAFFRLPN